MTKTMLISEKPDAAAKIAGALSEGGAVEKELNGVPYYEFERDGVELVTVPALGHLFTLKNKEPIRDYPMYDIAWVPKYEANNTSGDSEPFIKAIEELSEDVDEYINATDYDQEGAVIGYTILKYICGDGAVENSKRMKFSTLTKDELQESYDNLLPEMDRGLINSGVSRHMLDWYWGMNLSKALTSAVETAHDRFVKLSVGRVQTPTLKALLEREKEIEEFDPDPYWVIELLFQFDDQEVKGKFEEKKIFDEERAEEVKEKCEGKNAVVENIKTRKYTNDPPTPFNLSSLQSEAHNQFGYSPARTQQLAQSLYNDALISYPRTGSQKLPESIGYEEIIKNIGEIRGYKGRVRDLLKEQAELTPNEGKPDDPAHPAIYPTGVKPDDLEGPRRKVYDLIVKRFLSTFADEAVKQSVRVDLDIEGEYFFLRGRKILEEGWLRYYAPYGTSDEIILPEIEEGQTLEVKEFLYKEKETKPPARYNRSSTVKEMENKNLGTKATRAGIVESLFDRNYIDGQRIRVTTIGRQLIESLEEYCPEIISEEMTAHFEEEMKKIREGSRDKSEVLEKAKKKLGEILEEFREHEEEIGEPLGEAYRETRRNQKIMGSCGECEEGELKVIVSKRTGKRFAGCTNYPDCNNSFPLPQNGKIIPMDEICDECSEPKIKVIRKGKRPYTMCVNHRCPSKDDWGIDQLKIGAEKGEKINYQKLSNLNVSDIKEKSKELELDLEKILQAEKENKNRKSLKEWLDKKIESLDDEE
ncbi:MAG: DNA topoisomerase I [Candidatus Hadarchaeota archaeon]